MDARTVMWLGILALAAALSAGCQNTRSERVGKIPFVPLPDPNSISIKSPPLPIDNTNSRGRQGPNGYVTPAGGMVPQNATGQPSGPMPVPLAPGAVPATPTPAMPLGTPGAVGPSTVPPGQPTPGAVGNPTPSTAPPGFGGNANPTSGPGQSFPGGTGNPSLPTSQAPSGNNALPGTAATTPTTAGPVTTVGMGIPNAPTGPHVRNAPTAAGSLLNLAPGEAPVDRVVELARLLEAAGVENRALVGRIHALEATGIAREQALAEALREVETASTEVGRAKTDLEQMRKEITALKDRLEQVEKEDVETLKLVISALDKLVQNPPMRSTVKEQP